MNIFVLDTCPTLAAQMQCDKHVVKMTLETAQLLCTAQRQAGVANNVLYASTHLNHPCSVWTRATTANYKWLYAHFCALCDEYSHRYKRQHLSDFKLRQLLSITPPVPIGTLTNFALAMPEPYMQCSPVESYRAYYQSKQASFKVTWTNRQPPSWFKFNA